jgi:hypothetical protein
MTIQTGRRPSAMAPTSGGLRGALTSVRTWAGAAPRIRARPWAAAGICVDSGNRAGLIGHDNTHFLTRLGYNRQRPWAVLWGRLANPNAWTAKLSGLGRGLPRVSGLGRGLPRVSGLGRGLPRVSGLGRGLPRVSE